MKLAPMCRASEFPNTFPKLAKCADKYAILRGVSHTLAAHRLGAEYLMTGNRPLPSLKYPTYGAVVSKELGSPRDIPCSVAIPQGSHSADRFSRLGIWPTRNRGHTQGG